MTAVDAGFAEDITAGLRRFDFLDTRTQLADMIGALQTARGLRPEDPVGSLPLDDLPVVDLYLGCDKDDDALGRLCRVHWLTEVAQRVADVDGDDFVDVDDWRDVPAGVQELLEQASLPTTPSTKPTGLLRSMLPMFRILVELIDVSYERDDMDDVLKYLHLIAEYAPLLVWERSLGHAGQPDRFVTRVEACDDLWDADGRLCPEQASMKTALGSARNAHLNDAAWNTYLSKGLLRTAEVLASCGTSTDIVRSGTCKKPCGMSPKDDDRYNRASRLLSVRSFRTSSAVTLRHPSPLGHGFRVPDKSEVDVAWEHTISKLQTRPHYLKRKPRDADDWGGLRGLATLVSYWGGYKAVQQPTTILSDLVAAALPLLETPGR